MLMIYTKLKTTCHVLVCILIYPRMCCSVILQCGGSCGRRRWICRCGSWCRCPCVRTVEKTWFLRTECLPSWGH